MSAKKIEALYLRGKGEADPFAFYYVNLRPLLWKYARTIGRQTLDQVEDHLVDEMVDDMLMSIGNFNGGGKFSTWAYVGFRRRFIDEYRYQVKNLGSSLDSMQDDWEAKTDLDEEATSPYEPSFEPDIEQQLIVNEFKDRLSDRQRAVLDARLEGSSFEEIAAQLSISDSRAHEIWVHVLGLATEYGMEVAG